MNQPIPDAARTDDAFTLWRADLPDLLHRDHLTLPPETTVDCASEEWQHCLLVVEAGFVVLACTGGNLSLDQGAVFFVTGLHTPTLRNPHPTRATVSIARRASPISDSPAARQHHGLTIKPQQEDRGFVMNTTLSNAQDPAQEYREVAAHFTRLVEAVPDDATWNQPAPPEGWTARDVVRHLVEWFPPFLHQGAGLALPSGPDVEHDPVGAWRAMSEGIQAVLDDPTTRDQTFSDPHTGDLPVPQAISQFFTNDVFMHSWDLARATGQDETLDAERCAVMVAGMEPWDEALRSSGQYGPRVDVPDDADPQTRLLAFIGRDPRPLNYRGATNHPLRSPTLCGVLDPPPVTATGPPRRELNQGWQLRGRISAGHLWPAPRTSTNVRK